MTRIDVAIAMGKPSKMIKRISLWPNDPNMPSENSATLNADRPIIKIMAMSMRTTKVLTRLSSRSSGLARVERKRSVGQITAINRIKNTVSETTCSVRPAMMMPWPRDTPPAGTEVPLTEIPPPADCISRASTSHGMNTRAYSLGLMLNLPLPR